jgi:hypothetical protein
LVGVAAATLFLATSAQAQGKKDKAHKGHSEAVRGDHDDDRHHEVARDDHHVDQHQVLHDAQRRAEQRAQRDPRYDDRRNDPRYDDRRNDPRYDDRRNDPRYDNRDGRRIPPGLAKKPGGMPPGQYKKMYGTDHGAVVLRDVFGRRGYTVVRSAHEGESEYVYYRLRDGSVRRAVVSPGADRLRFSNVPSSLLSEVMARLY